jgi:hypothetical protein
MQMPLYMIYSTLKQGGNSRVDSQGLHGGPAGKKMKPSPGSLSAYFNAPTAKAVSGAKAVSTAKGDQDIEDDEEGKL